MSKPAIVLQASGSGAYRATTRALQKAAESTAQRHHAGRFLTGRDVCILHASDASGIMRGMQNTNRTRIIVAIPPALLDIVEDYRGSKRPVLSRNAAIVELLGVAARDWINDCPSDETPAKRRGQL